MIHVHFVYTFQTSGYNVGFDVSGDGKLLMSGSSDGSICFYDYSTSRLIHKLKDEGTTMDVQWHPVLNSTIAASSWNGVISVWS